ncbi:hypothetical protein E4T56_gene873 [Termitomyces sp. T112]|nr:hypothetical protein E4T56_gene873 [Termitomyces sp. T112]
MPPPSARGYLWADATLQHSPLIATTPACTLENTPQHPPTLPTSPPPITTCTQPLLQLQPLWGTQIIILLLVCHSLLKFPLPPDSKESKPTSNSAMKSSASSASPPWSLQEVWADWLLNFYECYLQGNLPKTTQGTLEIDINLQNKLCALIKEIYTSLKPHPFKDPLDPSCSFYVQCKEPVEMQSKAPPPIPCQQEELNVASSILRNLNPMGGLFDQLTTHTLALSTCPWANSVLSAFHTWDQPTISKPHSQWLPLHVNNVNWTLFYIDEPNQSKNMAPQTSWNNSGNTNWQVRTINSNQPLIPINPTNPTPCFPLGQGPSSTIQPLGQCPPSQLNTANLHEAPEPLDANPNNLDNILDSTEGQEALCANKIQDRPWIDIPEETQEG